MTIAQDGDNLGTTRFGVQKPEDSVVVFCGPLAEIDREKFALGGPININTDATDQKVLLYLARQFGDLQSYYEEALLFVSQPTVQQQIDLVANALLECTTLLTDEVRKASGFSKPLRPRTR